MFTISLFSGSATTLTPLVFPILLFSFFIFAKLSKSSKENWVNLILFSALTIISFRVLSQLLMSYDLPHVLEQLSTINIIIQIMTIIFALWLTGFLIKIIEEGGVKITDQIFRFFGIILLSCKLALASFSSAGPIIGAMMIEGNTSNVTNSLYGFSLGIVIPFIIVIGGIGGLLYKKQRDKKWIRVINAIIGILLLISSIYNLSLI